ncbi:MAG: hypothetical protein A2Z91_03240 [Deltaproteobacteria bacterium GWA2_38_16]|nr:MAG: hypothetical protein A2Z91_03240 [Deltaproteobacteria bacterium GWA2_38_16]OGQ02900.1 MAG: hypothetical protein A3D19_06670 [Deltaproteobacteria bacterium RIFCSPHIGHO2_02_FULL_38_15]HBQ21747.1 hypothetical protein [Deltaproteobacteria bacterium]
MNRNIHFLIYFLSVLLLAGCAGREVRQEEKVELPDSPTAQQELELLEKNSENLQHFIEKYPNTSSSLEAKGLLAQALYKQNRLEESYQLIENLNKEELNFLLERHGDSYPSSEIHFKLGQIFFNEGDQELSKEHFQKAVELTQEETQKAKIQEFISKISKVFKTQKNVIGCVLPLSGKYAPFGIRSLHGIQEALGFFSSKKDISFELAIYDSQGSAEEAARGVETLLEQHGVMAIIGPLLTPSSEAAALRAQQLHVPLLNLSQHPSITSIGDYVFRNAMTKFHQTDTLIRYACQDKGLKKFAILYPQDSYGVEFANQFWDAIEGCGGTLEGIEAYESDQEDFNDEIKKLVGMYQPKARKSEYHLAEEQLKIQLNKETVPQSQVKLPPQIDFEALFIPDYAKTVGQIVPTLFFHDVEGLHLLGTQGWNSQELLKRGGEYVSGAVFVDGFSESSLDPQVKIFVSDFEHHFDDTPQIWEAQAFDAATLLKDLLQKEEVQTREDLKNQLLALSEIKGVAGIAYFSDNHDVKKELPLLTVQEGKIISLETP